MTHRVNTRDYPADRIERYVTALNDADSYAQLERRDDRVRFARAVMAVADAETDPVYKSGYETGVMHAHAGRIAAERDCLAMAVQFAIQWRPDAPMGLREGIEEILSTMPAAGEKSSREATATPADKFTAVASPVEYGFMLAIRRDPHPAGHVPVALGQLRTGAEWSPEAADELLLSEYGYATAPGSYWQAMEGGRYGIRLHRAAGGDAG